MPLNLYKDIFKSGSVPLNWKPVPAGKTKYPVNDPDVAAYLQTLLPGRWQKVVSLGRPGDVHYFEHKSGQVAGVKHYEEHAC